MSIHPFLSLLLSHFLHTFFPPLVCDVQDLQGEIAKESKELQQLQAQRLKVQEALDELDQQKASLEEQLAHIRQQTSQENQLVGFSF